MESKDNPSIVVESNAGGCAKMKLFGEINVCLSADLHRRCVEIAGSEQDAIVDCEGVDSFDAATLQVLAAFKDSLASRGHKLQLSKLSHDSVETIRFSGMTQYFGENIAS
jgi:anti-anti-sigma factor